MVGLVGIVAHKKDIDIKMLIQKMCEAIKYEDRHNVEIYIDKEDKKIGIGRVHIGIFNPEKQPIFNEDRTIYIMMDGEIYNYQETKEETKKELISKGHNFLIDNDPEYVLHLYEEYGNEFIHKLNGCFSLVICDNRLNKLLIANDRFGLRPIYYTNKNGYLLFGSEVKAILQDINFKKVIDDGSIAEFFSFGYILGDKTFFQEIKILPPASIMTFKDNNISIEQYWDLDFNKDYGNYSEEYYIEKLSNFISQSVERRMKGNYRIAVLLSGGLDSRIIIASISNYSISPINPVHTITYGKKNCNDEKFAKIISNRLGTIHHFFEFKPDDIVMNIEKMVYMTDGMLNIFNAPRMQTYDAITEFNDVTLHGWIGDSIMGDYLNGHINNSNKDNFDIFKRICYFKPVELIRNLFRDSYFPIVENNLIISKNYIREKGKHIKLPENRLIYYNLKERQRRLTSVGFIYMRNYIESRTPFSDYDYIDFNLNIPPSFKYKKTLYKKFITRTFPQLVNIPYTVTGLPLNKSPILYEKRQLIRLMLNKITYKIFKSKLFSDKEKSLDDYGDWIRNNENLRSYISNILLDKRTLERPYFNQKFIKEILDSHLRGEKDNSMLIGLLITFELWNRQFVDR